MSELEHLLPLQNTLGEGPRWNEVTQRLYWVDIVNKCYYHYTPATGHYEQIHVGTQIGTLAFREQGNLILATQEGFAFWDEQTRQLHHLINPEAEKPHMRFNDGAVDCQGRFWAGSMDEYEQEDTGSLYRLDPDGSLHRILTNLGISNGIGWNPDNTIMYFIDSPRRTISAFDFNATTGTISNERPLVTITDAGTIPDGLTVDSEGGIWCAHWGGAKIVRYTPDGEVERIIPIPAPHVTSCTFGGPRMDELYITTARKALSTEQLARSPFSGDLFRLKVGIQGLPVYRFKG
ncbi:sugar lactone lactonase YvrE [Thermosporothrix hazakensis]|jgi:sugar lactone lactonase YvrE|uniref:Sugar lactone lactonase YvrE n=1 Tax=Thermosporothrix hazakensis TaxID=644383 RepID=A0A326UAY9_THEHA|nr:SMP-30/gluconolactonase/LRE family protein [Thermosporothrix hazakensis]PZW32110.1 sugar lactone lactonase YvrE [Thermosporothrix hazakensis]GCE49562.1 hypothetical protein KTH_44310 [Thermosporothrix hazakensis]